MPYSCHLGLMSGTSMDGIDAVAARFDQDTPQLLAASHTPYPETLTRELEQLITGGGQVDLPKLLELDYRIADAFASVARKLVETLPANVHVEAIGSHGQTIYHLPDGPTPNTLQLGNPALIVERTGLTTIADWRRRDMAAGGQGAPLAPAFHCHFLRSEHDIAVLNLGGIANITVIPGHYSAAPPVGFDTGPANTLLDGWTALHTGRRYDDKGRWAASGTVSPTLLEHLLNDPYFSLPPPKSTGREHFHLGWLEQILSTMPTTTPPPADVAATLVELTAHSVRKAMEIFDKTLQIEKLLVCGGGVHNDYLMQRLATTLAPINVSSTETAGIDPDYMEAMAFAWFANRTLAGLPIETSAFTGASGDRVLGAVYAA